MGARMKSHIYYFDHLRVFAALGVVFMHTAAPPLRMDLNWNWHLLNVVTSLAFTAVPLFFMISGYLLLSSEKTADVSVLLKRRLPRLIVPLIGWTGVEALWKVYSSGAFSAYAVVKRMVSAIASPTFLVFWFMYTLIAIYVISPILYGGIHALDRKGHIFVLVLIALVSLQAIVQALMPQKDIQVDLINDLGIFGVHLATFVLGYYLGSMKKKVPNGWLLGVGALLFGIISVGTYFLTKQNGTYTATFQKQSAGFQILLASCIFLLFKQNCNVKRGISSSLAPLMFGVYLMHAILLSMLYAVGINPVTFVQTVLVTLLDFLICLLTLKTVATIKPICYLATGMSFAQACGSCNWIYTYRRIKQR